MGRKCGGGGRKGGGHKKMAFLAAFVAIMCVTAVAISAEVTKTRTVTRDRGRNKAVVALATACDTAVIEKNTTVVKNRVGLIRRPALKIRDRYAMRGVDVVTAAPGCAPTACSPVQECVPSACEPAQTYEPTDACAPVQNFGIINQ